MGLENEYFYNQNLWLSGMKKMFYILSTNLSNHMKKEFKEYNFVVILNHPKEHPKLVLHHHIVVNQLW